MMLLRPLTILCLLSLLSQPLAFAVSPAAVGWGNTLVPGLGATLRGQSLRGLTEATLEIGSFYGGTFYAHEGAYTIDGTVLVPSGRNIVKPLLGEVLQEFGLKLHMFNTFYHYQQAALAPENVDLQKGYAQPLYTGAWDDVLLAPFKWKNLSIPWVYVPIGLATAFLIYSYRTESVVQQNYHSSLGEEALYAFAQAGAVPLGSSFGEDAFYRGFMMREFREYTGSSLLATLLETTAFTFSHQPSLRPGAAAGGLYLSFLTNKFDGNLEPAIATHFWIDFVSGLLVYFSFRKVEGKSVPLSAQLTIPF